MDSPRVQRAGTVALLIGLADKISARLGTALGIFTDYEGFLDWTLATLSKAAVAMSADTALILIGGALLLWSQFADRIRAGLGRPVSAGPALAPSPGEARLAEPAAPLDTSAVSPAGAHDALDARLSSVETRLSGDSSPEHLRKKLANLDSTLDKTFEIVRDHEKMHKLLIDHLASTDKTAEGVIEEVKEQKATERRVRHWMAQMARAQLDATRSLSAARLIGDSPPVPRDGEEAGAEVLEQFSRDVTGYLGSVEGAADSWELPERNLAFVMGQAASDAERDLEQADSERRLDAASFGTLRRYKIAVRQRAAVVSYLKRQRKLLEGNQELALTGLIEQHKDNRPKFTDS